MMIKKKELKKIIKSEQPDQKVRKKQIDQLVKNIKNDKN